MTRDEEIAIEWDCQKVLRHYYHLVDQKRYEEAVQIFHARYRMVVDGC